MMPSGAQIAIDRLRVKASRRNAALIVNDLENGTWPLAVDEQQWLFIRQLSVTASQAELRLRSAQALDSKIHRAVDGRSPAARDADVVYFQSFPQLLAFLLRDLALADLARKWYWQRWAWLLRETREQAVTRLLWENSEFLPAIIEELMVIDSLPLVWRQLSADGALQILQRLPGPSGRDRDTGDATEAVAGHNSGPNYQLARQGFYRRQTALQPWSAALTALPDSDPRRQLAAVIAGQQYCPLVAARDRQALIRAFNALLESLDGSAAAPVPDDGKAADDMPHVQPPGPLRTASAVAPAASDTTASDVQDLQVDADRPARLHGNPDTAMPQREEAAGMESAPEDVPVFGAEDALPQSPEERLAKDGKTEAPGKYKDVAASTSGREFFESGEETTAGLAFTSRCAGLFYLINALNDEECLDLLWQNRQLAHGSGWLWLFALARHLHEDLDQPMLQFIAEQCGCQDVDTLLALPPIAYMDDVAAMLDTRYLDQDFWNDSLIQVPARVAATASHIDVYFPLAAVRLPVRLAALDVNPGWVPWLGRVVTFYYRDTGPEGLQP